MWDTLPSFPSAGASRKLQVVAILSAQGSRVPMVSKAPADLQGHEK